MRATCGVNKSNLDTSRLALFSQINPQPHILTSKYHNSISTTRNRMIFVASNSSQRELSSSSITCQNVLMVLAKSQWVQNPKLGFQVHNATCGAPSSKPSIHKAWSTSQATKNQQQSSKPQSLQRRR